jgi:glycosyltransferase involved in cell wall biosynthesis
MLTARHPQLRFLIVGDGPRRAALESLVAQHGLRPRVEFMGHREDIEAILSDADLFVLPSRSEAFPNAAIEAMASGLPVVASAVGGLLDLIEPYRTGVLVPSDNPGALAAAIDALVSAPDRAARIGTAARETVATRYSFDRMVSSFEALYRSELGVRLPGARPVGAAA